MPWNHCDNEAILDDVECPACGISKEAWTLEFNMTRTFQVKRRTALRLALIDRAAEPVAGEPYRVELPDGDVREGELDEEGFVRITHDQSGDCTISFPGRAPGTVVEYVDPDEEEDEAEDEDEESEAPEEEDGAEGEGGEESDEDGEAEEEDGPPTFTLPANRRHTFQLRPGRVLQLTLLDADGYDPLPFVSYVLEAEDETRFEGETDGWGRLDHGPVRQTRFTLTVTVPETEEEAPADEDDDEEGETADESGGEVTQTVSSVFEVDAFEFVRVAGIPAGEHEAHENNRPLEDNGSLSNPRWSATSARFDEVVELIVDAEGVPEGELVEFEIFEHDAEGDDDAVMIVAAPVEEGVARAAWHMLYVDDSDDVPTELDEQVGFNLPEFVFLATYGESEVPCEDQLVFSTELELPVRDAQGNPLADTEYTLVCGSQTRRGRTDGEGVLRESGVGPNFQVRMATGASLEVLTAS